MFSFLERKNSKRKVITIPQTPLTTAYMKEFHRQIRIYRPQIIEERGLAQDANMLDVFDDSKVIVMHQVAWLWALNESGRHFRGRDAHRNRGALKDQLKNDNFEWCQLACAAQSTGRSQLRLWNAMCLPPKNNPGNPMEQIARNIYWDDPKTPLGRVARSVQGKGIDSPPFACLVGEGGGLFIIDR